MHPILFQIGPITIYSLWLLISIGIIIAGYVFQKFTLKNKLKIEFIIEKSLSLLLIFIISARLFFIILNFNSYFYEFSLHNFLLIFFIWDKGLYFWPGFLISLVTFGIICHQKKENFLKWCDVITIPTLIGLLFFYIGAFFEGIKYGKETELPIGVTFESPTVQYNIPIHPTQLYTAFICLIIITALIYLFKTKRASQSDGLISLIGSTSFSLWYFIEGFIRGDDTILIGEIRLPQILSLIFFIISATLIYLKFFKNNKIQIFDKNIDHFNN